MVSKVDYKIQKSLARAENGPAGRVDKDNYNQPEINPQ